MSGIPKIALYVVPCVLLCVVPADIGGDVSKSHWFGFPLTVVSVYPVTDASPAGVEVNWSASVSWSALLFNVASWVALLQCLMLCGSYSASRLDRRGKWRPSARRLGVCAGAIVVIIGVLIYTWINVRMDEERTKQLQAEGTLDPLDWFAKRAGQIVCPPSTVTNYIQLVEAFNKRFRSEMLVPLRGEGPPYPRLFPVGEYFWLRSWDMAKDAIDTPLLWVVREPRETRVEYVTLGGEHKSESYGRFVRLIQPHVSRVVAVGDGMSSRAGQ